MGYMQIITNHKTDLSRQIIKIIIFIKRLILLSNHRAPIAPGDRKIKHRIRTVDRSTDKIKTVFVRCY